MDLFLKNGPKLYQQIKANNNQAIITLVDEVKITLKQKKDSFQKKYFALLVTYFYPLFYLSFSKNVCSPRTKKLFVIFLLILKSILAYVQKKLLDRLKVITEMCKDDSKLATLTQNEKKSQDMQDFKTLLLQTFQEWSILFPVVGNQPSKYRIYFTELKNQKVPFPESTIQVQSSIFESMNQQTPQQPQPKQKKQLSDKDIKENGENLKNSNNLIIDTITLNSEENEILELVPLLQEQIEYSLKKLDQGQIQNSNLDQGIKKQIIDDIKFGENFLQLFKKLQKKQINYQIFKLEFNKIIPAQQEEKKEIKQEEPKQVEPNFQDFGNFPQQGDQQQQNAWGNWSQQPQQTQPQSEPQNQFENPMFWSQPGDAFNFQNQFNQKQPQGPQGPQGPASQFDSQFNNQDQFNLQFDNSNTQPNPQMMSQPIEQPPFQQPQFPSQFQSAPINQFIQPNSNLEGNQQFQSQPGNQDRFRVQEASPEFTPEQMEFFTEDQQSKIRGDSLEQQKSQQEPQPQQQYQSQPQQFFQQPVDNFKLEQEQEQDEIQKKKTPFDDSGSPKGNQRFYSISNENWQEQNPQFYSITNTPIDPTEQQQKQQQEEDDAQKNQKKKTPFDFDFSESSDEKNRKSQPDNTTTPQQQPQQQKFEFDDFFNPQNVSPIPNEQIRKTESPMPIFQDMPTMQKQEVDKDVDQKQQEDNQKELNFDDFYNVDDEEIKDSHDASEDSAYQYAQQQLKQQQKQAQQAKIQDKLNQSDSSKPIESDVQPVQVQSQTLSQQQHNTSDSHGEQLTQSEMLKSNPFKPVPQSEMHQYMDPDIMTQNPMEKQMQKQSQEAPFSAFPFMETTSPIPPQFETFLFDDQSQVKEEEQQNQKNNNPPPPSNEQQRPSLNPFMNENFEENNSSDINPKISLDDLFESTNQDAPKSQKYQQRAQNDLTPIAEVEETPENQSSLHKRPSFLYRFSQQESDPKQDSNISESQQQNQHQPSQQSQDEIARKIIKTESDKQSNDFQSQSQPQQFDLLDFDNLNFTKPSRESQNFAQKQQEPSSQQQQDFDFFNNFNNNFSVPQDNEQNDNFFEINGNPMDDQSEGNKKQKSQQEFNINILPAQQNEQSEQKQQNQLLDLNSNFFPANPMLDQSGEKQSKQVNQTQELNNNFLSVNNSNEQFKTFQTSPQKDDFDTKLVDSYIADNKEQKAPQIQQMQQVPQVSNDQIIEQVMNKVFPQIMEIINQSNQKHFQQEREVAQQLHLLTEKLEQAKKEQENNSKINNIEQCIGNLSLNIQENYDQLMKAIEDKNIEAQLQQIEAIQNEIKDLKDQVCNDEVDYNQIIQKIELIESQVQESNDQIRQINDNYETLKKMTPIKEKSEEEQDNQAPQINYFSPKSPLDAQQFGNLNYFPQQVMSQAQPNLYSYNSPQMYNTQYQPNLQYSNASQPYYAQKPIYYSNYQDIQKQSNYYYNSPMNYQINNYNINVFANSVSPHEGFDQNHLKIKANNVYRQKYLKFLEPNEMNTYKKMCINDSAVLVESFELFVTGKYMLVEEEQQQVLKVVVTYKNKSQFEMSHLVVLLNPQNAKDNFYVNPLKISHSKLKQNESLQQIFVFQEYDPNNVNLSCHVGYQLQRYRRQMIINLPRSANKFMEQQFVSNEVMNDAFENEQVDKIMQSDEFNGNVENAKNILNWMIDLDQKNGLKQIGGKVDLWCQGKQHSYLMKIQQNRGNKMVIQVIDEMQEKRRLTKQIESVVSTIVFMIQQ